MPTVFSHPAVPLAARLALGRDIVPGPLLAAGVLLCVLPDLDVAAFRLGVSYADALGHRGFSHSLAFAAAASLAAALFHRRLGVGFARAWLFLFVCAASHPLLDAFTDGGLGVALLWPFSAERFFAPVRPIEVSPLGLRRFLSGQGARVLLSEFLWVWLPLTGLAAAWKALAARRSGRP